MTDQVINPLLPVSAEPAVADVWLPAVDWCAADDWDARADGPLIAVPPAIATSRRPPVISRPGKRCESETFMSGDRSVRGQKSPVQILRLCRSGPACLVVFASPGDWRTHGGGRSDGQQGHCPRPSPVRHWVG